MAERRSALAHLAASAAVSSPTTLREVGHGSIVQIAAWPDSVAAVHRAVAEFLRIEAPPPLGQSSGDDAAAVLAIGPGRFFIAGDAEDLPARLEAALPSADGAVTDLSHGRTVLRLEGQGAAAILARCVAIDLDLRAFPPGRVAQTAMHHVDVTIRRRGEEVFDLWVLRSFAEALVEWLLDAGAEFGVGFR